MKTNAETHAENLRALADEYVGSVVRLGDKYLNLCRYIRENMVSPKLVKETLKAKGLSPSVVGKILRVANTAPDWGWIEYDARRIGFERLLSITRNPVRNAVAVSVGCCADEIAAYEARRKQERELSKPSEEEKLQRDFDEAANSVLRLAEGISAEMLPMEFRGSGYVLVVKRDEKFFADGADSENLLGATF